MKVVLAPDSFKGSSSAKRLCDAISFKVKQSMPFVEIAEFPLADGGEGTVENLIHATNGTIHKVSVFDPLKRTIEAVYGVLGDGETAVIEMAEASGLPLLSENEKDPLKASSYGTGQLIKAALDAGYRKFIIGLGGSATNDGGVGMLEALGLELLDSKAEPVQVERLPELEKIQTLRTDQLDPRIQASKFIIASDVENSLCGPLGASAVFGPQKGATPEMVEQLDKILYHWSILIERQTGLNVRDATGSGAAGGMGAALLAFFGAQMQPGIDIMIETVGLAAEVPKADLIITGEGKLDEQTLSGKAIAGICRISKSHGTPVVAICGMKELTSAQISGLGLSAAYSIVPGPCTLQESIQHTEEWAGVVVEQVIRTFLAGDSKLETSGVQVR